MSILAAIISGSPLVNALIYLLVVGVILALLVWLVGKSPIPEPFRSVLTWILYVVGVIFLCDFLLSLIGRGFLNL